MTRGWFVVFVFLGEAKIIDTFLMGPAFASRLTVSATQRGKMGSWLDSPGVLIVAIVHAVHIVEIRLDTHTGTIIFNPFA
jgi:hypothetical protein